LYRLQLAGAVPDRRVSTGEFDEPNSQTLFGEPGVSSVLLFWPDANYVHWAGDTGESIDAWKQATMGEVLTLTLLIMAGIRTDTLAAREALAIML